MAMMNELMEDMTGGLTPFDAPIPGESLTSSPEEQLPFERAPEYTNEDQALQHLFVLMTSEEQLDSVLDAMRGGLPIEDIAAMVLFTGFREGLYNADLLLLLQEPMIYLLLSLAEYAGIDPVLAPEYKDDLDIPLNMEDFDMEGIPDEITLPTGQVLRRPSLLEPEGESPEAPVAQQPEAVV